MASVKMMSIGNIKDPRTLLAGTTEDVRGEVFYALHVGVDIIAPECAAPLICKLANIKAVREHIHEYHRLR
jgi:uroporphyrinogen-III decarboxylase